MTQMVEHMITSAINDSALEYGVIQSAASHEILRRPFGLVVRRAAVWTSSQKADENYLSNAGSISGNSCVSCAFDMHAPVGLLSEFTVDASAMNDGLTAGKALRQLIDIIQPAEIKASSWKLTNVGIGPVLAAGHEHEFVSFHDQRPGEVAADKSGSSCYGDFQSVTPSQAASRYTRGR